jgi:hypothetical protein
MSFFLSTCPRCGARLEVVTEPQKLAFQMICLELERGCEWPVDSGEHIDAKHWAQLMILAYEREHEREAKILPALDGDGWDVVFKRFSRLEKQEGSEVLAFANAWAADHGVMRKLSARERRREKDPEACGG